MKITIYGAGYVGLVTGACFAKLGHDVLCVDIDEQKVNQLQRGEIPIFEPTLEDIVLAHSKLGSLKFTTRAKDGVEHGLIQFICVNTPTSAGTGANVTYLMQCVKTIAENMNEYRLIVNKSTAPIGTVQQIRLEISRILDSRGLKALRFDVACNPEFLREGAAVRDFLEPDRIIVGTDRQDARQLLDDLYSSFNLIQDKVIHMDIESAELTKYAANAILATKVSFINEIANIAEKVGADINHVRRGIATDPRIGPHFISPGCGYGGSCFPKDVNALIHIAQSVGIEPHILKAVEAVNFHQKELLYFKLKHYFNGDLSNKTIALWGLAFKPNTNDIREASSRVLMEKLWQEGAQIKAYDPVAMTEIRLHYPDESKLTLCASKDECLLQADALVICTEWPEFGTASLERIKTALSRAVVFDGRNILNKDHAEALGFEYFGIGR